jgi:hypothetical protein
MKLKTKNEINGYKFSNGSAGKRWVRGRTMYSEGKQFLGHDIGYRPIIAKTNLDTGEITEASVKEYKKFLTEECYQEYLLGRFTEMAMRG